MVNWILNGLLPTLISDAVLTALPDSVAPLLHAGSHNSFTLAGAIRIMGEISAGVWRAPLDKSSHARNLLGLTQEEVQLLRKLWKSKDRGQAAGMHRKKLSRETRLGDIGVAHQYFAVQSSSSPPQNPRASG